jgi:hypothetical protein
MCRLGEGCDPQAQRNGARRKARCGARGELLADRRYQFYTLAHDPADVFHSREEGGGADKDEL